MVICLVYGFLQMVLLNDYNRDKLANEEFGIHVGGELASVDARVLPPPMVNMFTC